MVVALILALHKKSTSQPQEKVLIQTNTTSVTIRTHRTSTSQLDVATNKTITRVEYQVVITHPNQTDLLVQLSKQGGSVTYTIWNNQSFSGTNTISGQTHVFDGMTSAGTWLVSVDNSGGQTGTIDQWTLKIYYLE